MSAPHYQPTPTAADAARTDHAAFAGRCADAAEHHAARVDHDGDRDRAHVLAAAARRAANVAAENWHNAAVAAEYAAAAEDALEAVESLS